MYVLSENIRKIKPYVEVEANVMEEFSLHKLKRGSLRKQHFQQQQSNNNDSAGTAEFIYNRSQQKCSNISIQLPFEIHSNDKESLDTSDSLANNNLFLQTPVLNLKFEISRMENNNLAAKKEAISMFSKADIVSPNRSINNNLNLVDSKTNPSTIATTPNIDLKKQKAPTTPHRIVCQFRSLEEANVSDVLATKTNENDMLKVCFPKYFLAYIVAIIANILS